jgi:hypothetical protein
MKTAGWVVGYILILTLTACGEVNRGSSESSSAQQLGPSPVVGPSAPVTPPPQPPPTPSPPAPSSPPGATTATLQSLSISPSSIRQQGQPTGVVTFSAATDSTANVVLETSNKDVPRVPAAVTVKARNSTASFAIDTSSVAANTTVTITAKHGGISRTATLTVMAGPAPENRPGPTPPSPQPNPPSDPPCRLYYLCDGFIDSPVVVVSPVPIGSPKPAR